MLALINLQYVVALLELPVVLCHIQSLQELAAQRRDKLEASLALQQFYRDLDEEEAWIRYCILIQKYNKTK